MGSPRISCCMIVKNEEAFLGRCLSSVAPFVDEIIIVDTGSEDRTVEIARAFTEKIYFHPWENDFSKHRNQSISYATGNWILQIDADEELAPGGGDAIRKAIGEAAPDVNFLMVNITDIDQQGRPRATWNFPRVFRNGVGIHYEGIVHNQVVGKGIAVPCAATIWHYGYYLDEEKMEAKRKRSIPLLLKQLEEDPENVFALYNLANMYLGAKDYKRVIEYAERALRILKKRDVVSTFYISLYATFIHSLIKEGRLDEARKHAEDSVKIYPNYLDGYYLLNEVAFLQGDWNKAKESGLCALELYKKIADPHFKGSVIWFFAHSKGHLALRTGAALVRLGEVENATEFFEVGIQSHPFPDSAFKFVLNTLQEARLDDLYNQFLELALAEYPKDGLLNKLKLKALMDAGASQDSILEVFDRLVEADPEEDWELRKALFYLDRGRLKDAEAEFTRIIGKRGQGAPHLLAFRALVREKIGDKAGAISDHRLALAVDPGFGPSWMKLGEFSLSQGEWKAAWEYFRRAKASGLEGPEVDLRMGILGIRLGEVALSVEPLDRLLGVLGVNGNRCIETVEDLAALFEEIGKLLDRRGKTRLAAEAYGIAGELDPRKVELAVMAGKRLLSLGDPAMASLQLEAALRAAPGDREVLRGIEEVLREAAVG